MNFWLDFPNRLLPFEFQHKLFSKKLNCFQACILNTLGQIFQLKKETDKNKKKIIILKNKKGKKEKKQNRFIDRVDVTSA